VGRERDGAEQTDIESFKGGISGALKRAGAAWGIGRYLYNLEEDWADIVSDRGAGVQQGETKDGTRFFWRPPHLPAWALPKTGAAEAKPAKMGSPQRATAAPVPPVAVPAPVLPVPAAAPPDQEAKSKLGLTHRQLWTIVEKMVPQMQRAYPEWSLFGSISQRYRVQDLSQLAVDELQDFGLYLEKAIASREADFERQEDQARPVPPAPAVAAGPVVPTGDLGKIKVPFGKYNKQGKKLEDIPGEELADYARFLRRSSAAKNESPNKFVDTIEAYLTSKGHPL
jgi:hypothetical protein